jgi:tetratricopeptide (TPR) repeat protein
MNTMPKVTIVLRSAGAAPKANDGEGGEAPALPPRPAGGCNEVREFLAMRARQRKAEARARRIRRSVLAVATAGAAAAVVIRWQPTFGPLLTGARPPAAYASLAAPPASLASPASLATPASPTPPATPVTPASLAPEPAPGPAPAASFAAAAISPAAAAAPSAAAAATDTGCADDFKARRWRAAVDSCTRAFAAAPSPAVALWIAHAQWSSGRVQPAGEWAARALALGSEDADAFVLVGHARRQAGDAQDAIQAYRSYLRWAPRGWHARSVRAALRRLRPQNHDEARNSDGGRATSAQRAIDSERLAGRL